MTWNWPSYIAGVLTLPGILAVAAAWWYFDVTRFSERRRK